MVPVEIIDDQSIKDGFEFKCRERLLSVKARAVTLMHPTLAALYAAPAVHLSGELVCRCHDRIYEGLSRTIFTAAGHQGTKATSADIGAGLFREHHGRLDFTSHCELDNCQQASERQASHPRTVLWETRRYTPEVSKRARYELIRTLATGGMAHVYEAIAHGERGFERRVAVKRVLPEYHHDPSVMRMFVDEARIASRLHHGNIVQVLDYGLVDGTELLVMELVEGSDLRLASERARAAGSPIPPALAYHVMSQVAYALAYAHAHAGDDGEGLGIVHRDVSPQNILLSWDGDVKLSDFGIASFRDREERTETGVVKGKLSYMPPEQFQGKRVTASADVYALGATLHALLAGDVPMASHAAQARRLAGEPVILDGNLTKAAASLIEACMARHPEARPGATDLADQLGALAHKQLDRDARGALQSWLAPLRSDQKTGGALDDLAGLFLVSSGTDDRSFTVTRGIEDNRDQSRTGSAENARPKQPHPIGMRSVFGLGGKRSRLRLAITATLFVGSLVGLTQTWSVFEPRRVSSFAFPDVKPRKTRARGTEVAATDKPPATTATRRSEPEAAPNMLEAQRSLKPSGRFHRTNLPVTTVPQETSMPGAAVARGWLRVGHPREAGQEQVFVDGQLRGYTPNLFQVAVGSRRVEVRNLASGDVVASGAVQVRADQTRVHPAVFSR